MLGLRSRKRVGVIGLGIIGSRVVDKLRGAGYQVYVWNRTPKPIPNFVGSPLELAKICDTIQIFVADDSALHECIDALSPELKPRHTILNHATVSEKSSLAAADKVASARARYLDAPFTGSKDAAANGELVYYLGGDDAVCKQATSLLEVSSKEIIRLGNIGEAAILKLATNMITAATVQILSESLALVEQKGIPGETLQRAIEANACKSGVTGIKLPKMLAHDYDPHFSAKHMGKDIHYALDLARELNLHLPISENVAAGLDAAIDGGLGENDFAIIRTLYPSNYKKSNPEAISDEDKEPPSPAAPEPESKSIAEEPKEKASDEPQPPFAKEVESKSKEPDASADVAEKASSEPKEKLKRTTGTDAHIEIPKKQLKPVAIEPKTKSAKSRSKFGFPKKKNKPSSTPVAEETSTEEPNSKGVSETSANTEKGSLPSPETQNPVSQKDSEPAATPDEKPLTPKTEAPKQPLPAQIKPQPIRKRRMVSGRRGMIKAPKR